LVNEHACGNDLVEVDTKLIGAFLKRKIIPDKSDDQIGLISVSELNWSRIFETIFNQYTVFVDQRKDKTCKSVAHFMTSDNLSPFSRIICSFLVKVFGK